MLSEARLHPALVEQLNSTSVKTFEDGIAIIAAYCDVIMDGMYTGQDIVRLAGILYNRLKAKRGSIII